MYATIIINMWKKNKYLIVGLGNPGSKYAHTRHNVGFDTIDKFKYNLYVSDEKNKLSSEFSACEIEDNKIYIIKPLTYMNNSGFAVRRAMNFYRIKPENVIIVYDDVDIPAGKIRIRKKGSAGSHNGMKSIISNIRTYDFPRIRIGIGKPEPGTSMVDYVLGKPKGDEKYQIDKAIDTAADALESIITGGIEKAMQEYNK